MTCQLSFLPVGNADSFVIQSDDSTVVVDIGNLNILEDWLEVNQVHRLDRIYITHAHRDHFPPLTRLADFLESWFRHGTVEKICIPDKVWRIAKSKILADRNNPKLKRLELALSRIREWNSESTLKISPVVRDGEEYSAGSLKIQALHPGHLYIENYLAQGGQKLNEISLVLRVSYGNFSALLLADIEGDGLRELFNFLQINSKHNDFSSNIVKLPHHGAWPSNNADLVSLLTLINAEIAILSVGSTNQHSHVKPELFRALLEMSSNTSLRLGRFICTEVTRTCARSESEAVTMGKKGLAKKMPCAGEITVVAETSGQWRYETETNHPDIVASLPHAACKANLAGEI